MASLGATTKIVVTGMFAQRPERGAATVSVTALPSQKDERDCLCHRSVGPEPARFGEMHSRQERGAGHA